MRTTLLMTIIIVLSGVILVGVAVIIVLSFAIKKTVSRNTDKQPPMLINSDITPANEDTDNETD